jgi:predicted transcriptional regulator
MIRGFKMNITVEKSFEELKLTNVDEVYCYIDYNKMDIDVRYNDEQKIKMNIIKIIQKSTKSKVSLKTIFQHLIDIKIKLDKQLERLTFEIELNKDL